MEEKNLEWNEVQPNVWKPEQLGDSVEGILIGVESDKGSYGSQAYLLEEKGEKQVLVWGSAVLDERMKYVEVGTMVKIEYKGTEKNKILEV